MLFLLFFYQSLNKIPRAFHRLFFAGATTIHKLFMQEKTPLQHDKIQSKSCTNFYDNKTIRLYFCFANQVLLTVNMHHASRELHSRRGSHS